MPPIQVNLSWILFSPLGLPTSRAALHKHFRDLWWDFQMFTAGLYSEDNKKVHTWRQSISSSTTSWTVIQTVELVYVKEAAGKVAEVGAAGADLPEEEQEGDWGDQVEERLVEVDAQGVAVVDQLSFLVRYQLSHFGAMSK